MILFGFLLKTHRADVKTESEENLIRERSKEFERAFNTLLEVSQIKVEEVPGLENWNSIFSGLVESCAKGVGNEQQIYEFETIITNVVKTELGKRRKKTEEELEVEENKDKNSLSDEERRKLEEKIASLKEKISRSEESIKDFEEKKPQEPDPTPDPTPDPGRPLLSPDLLFKTNEEVLRLCEDSLLRVIEELENGYGGGAAHNSSNSTILKNKAKIFKLGLAEYKKYVEENPNKNIFL